MDSASKSGKKIIASVGILTFNSGKVLRRALESVKKFDDIVLCDGGSTDDTLEIAHTFGARVIQQNPEHKNANGTLKNFGGVRQQTLEAAKHDWFLYIDSDETISNGLCVEIQEATSKPYAPKEALVYRVPYGIVMDGRPIRYSSNFPGYQYRFFNKKSGAYFIKEVHERISFDPTKIVIGTFRNPWYTYARRADSWNYLRDTRGYRELQARSFRGRTFEDYLKFVVVRCLNTSAGGFLKALRNYLLHGFRDTAPLGDEIGRILSPLFLIGDTAKEMLFHSHMNSALDTSGKIWLWSIFPNYFLAKTFKHIDHPTKEDITSRRDELELFILPALLNQNSNGVFIDVGANIGSYVYVAQKYIPRKNIYTFEPQSGYTKRLQAFFKGIHVETIALSSHEGVAEFKIPTIKGTLRPTRGTLEDFKEDGEEDTVVQTVSLTTLDAYCASHQINDISVIKIDVEGHEKLVLEGAHSMISSLHPILIVEIEQRHHQESIESIFSYIDGLGYKGYFFDSATEKLVSISEFDPKIQQRKEDIKTRKYINNFIFFARGTQVPEVKLPSLH